MRVLVTGAGGFIGGHLVDALVEEGHDVDAIDIKPIDSWEGRNSHAINFVGSLRDESVCRKMMGTQRYDEVYNLAANMGGMGYIETHKLECMLNAEINFNMFKYCATRSGRFFYASSACVYPSYRQDDANVTALKESDAYPADPEDGYGWEKLFSERLAFHYGAETATTARVARYHNVYGPRTAWNTERAKAPAAICRKVIEAKLSGTHEIEIWGDGEQTRSFMFADDCVKGTMAILRSDIDEPINLGSSELVTINELVSIAEGFADITLDRKYNLDAPLGVRGRNSDNTKILDRLGWEPSIPLADGLGQLYEWIYKQMVK